MTLELFDTTLTYLDGLGVATGLKEWFLDSPLDFF